MAQKYPEAFNDDGSLKPEWTERGAKHWHWISIYAAEFSEPALRRWTSGCLWLKGDKLRYREVEYSKRGIPYARPYFLKRQLDDIKAAREGDSIVRADGWLSYEEAAQDPYMFSEEFLRAWSVNPSPENDENDDELEGKSHPVLGHPIESKWAIRSSNKVRSGAQRVRVFLRKDLDKLLEVMRADRKDVEWLSEAEVSTEFPEIGKPTTKRRPCLYGWRTKGCAALGGRLIKHRQRVGFNAAGKTAANGKITEKIVTKIVRGKNVMRKIQVGSHGSVWEYWHADLVQIRALYNELKKFPSSTYKDDEGEWLTQNRVAKAPYKISPQKLVPWRRAGQCPWLEKLRYKPVLLMLPTEALSFRELWVYHKDDIVKIADLIRKTTKEHLVAQHNQADWILRREAAKICKVSYKTVVYWETSHCPYLPCDDKGQPRATHPSTLLPVMTPHGKREVAHVWKPQIEWIRDKMKGLKVGPEPRFEPTAPVETHHAPPAPNAMPRQDKRGRPPLTASARQRRLEIVDGWERAKAARVSRKDYCGSLSPPITVQTLEDYQTWCWQRRPK